MNTNPLQEGSIIIHGIGIGTVTRGMVRERAVEPAVINGRLAHEASKLDWDEARQSLENLTKQPPIHDFKNLGSRRMSRLGVPHRLMGLVPMDPFVGAAEGADLGLDPFHQLEGRAALLPTGAAAHRAVQANLGQRQIKRGWGRIAHGDHLPHFSSPPASPNTSRLPA